jgi:hypothetical protein
MHIQVMNFLATNDGVKSSFINNLLAGIMNGSILFRLVMKF